MKWDRLQLFPVVPIFIRITGKIQKKYSTNFIKRPIVIEAEQWFPGEELPGVQGVNPNKLCGCILFGLGTLVLHVHTIHDSQVVKLEAGDWIIPEPDGVHFYPVTNDIFQATYELVEAEETLRLLDIVAEGKVSDET